jgi:hypothetical protein
MSPRLALFVLLLSLAMLPVHADPPRLQTSGDIRYACGGIGSDERRALESLREDARLEVVFASAKRGAYLSDVLLAIQRSGAPAVEIVANGPICIVDGPPGSYRIEARAGDAVRSQVVRIAPGRGHTRIVMAFPDEPWDGIRASEEEKRQAREP